MNNTHSGPTSPAGAGNKQTRAPGLFNGRRHAAKRCSMELQAHERDLNESSRVAKAGPLAERFIIVIQAEPHATPPPIRLRQALKLLLRAFGFRCIDVREVKQGEPLDIPAGNMGKATGDGE